MRRGAGPASSWSPAPHPRPPSKCSGPASAVSYHLVRWRGQPLGRPGPASRARRWPGAHGRLGRRVSGRALPRVCMSSSSSINPSPWVALGTPWLWLAGLVISCSFSLRIWAYTVLPGRFLRGRGGAQGSPQTACPLTPPCAVRPSLLCSPAVWPWACHLTSLSLGILVCNMPAGSLRARGAERRLKDARWVGHPSGIQNWGRVWTHASPHSPLQAQTHPLLLRETSEPCLLNL